MVRGSAAGRETPLSSSIQDIDVRKMATPTWIAHRLRVSKVNVIAGYKAACIGRAAVSVARDVHEGAQRDVRRVNRTDPVVEVSAGGGDPVPGVVDGLSPVGGVVPRRNHVGELLRVVRRRSAR